MYIELEENDIKLIIEIIHNFVIQGKKKEISEYDKETDKIINKLNNPISFEELKERK